MVTSSPSRPGDAERDDHQRRNRLHGRRSTGWRVGSKRPSLHRVPRSASFAYRGEPRKAEHQRSAANSSQRLHDGVAYPRQRAGPADGGRPDRDYPAFEALPRHAGVRRQPPASKPPCTRRRSESHDRSGGSHPGRGGGTVRTGDATSMEVLDACWRTMEAVNPKLNATTWLDREGAERGARGGPCGARETLARPAPRCADDHRRVPPEGRLSTCGSRPSATDVRPPPPWSRS